MFHGGELYLKPLTQERFSDDFNYGMIVSRILALLQFHCTALYDFQYQ